MAKCGNCGQVGVSVEDIRECYARAGNGNVTRTERNEVFPREPVKTPVVEDGYYADMTGDIFKVQESQTSGRLYAKLLVVEDGSGRWEYTPGALRNLYAEDRLSEEQAREFGRLYGVCCICGRTLTNEESIAAGIGPICSGKQGWSQ